MRRKTRRSRTLLGIVLGNFDVFAGPVISILYPICASIIAIETGSRNRVRQWLSYWVLHSMITLFELSFAKTLKWIPIWPYTKLILICCLVIPNFSTLMKYLGFLTLRLVYGFFSGIAYVYEHFVRPFFVKHRLVGVWHVPLKSFFSYKLDGILTTWKHIYIEENGEKL